MTRGIAQKRRRAGARFTAEPPAPMDGPAFAAARLRLGLTAAALGRALGLEGRDPGQSIRLWEDGRRPVSGPVRVALRYMLAEHARNGPQEAARAALTDSTCHPSRTPADPLSGPQIASPTPAANAMPAAPRQRRRGPTA